MHTFLMPSFYRMERHTLHWTLTKFCTSRWLMIGFSLGWYLFSPSILRPKFDYSTFINLFDYMFYSCVLQRRNNMTLIKKLLLSLESKYSSVTQALINRHFLFRHNLGNRRRRGEFVSLHVIFFLVLVN